MTSTYFYTATTLDGYLADDNDSLDFEDGWDKPMAAEVDRLFGDTPLARWKHAEALYAQAGASAAPAVSKKAARHACFKPRTPLNQLVFSPSTRVTQLGDG